MSKNVLTQIEKILIATTSNDHILYNCSEYGVFSKDKEITDPKCVFKECIGIVKLLENSDQLREKFKKEFKS